MYVYIYIYMSYYMFPGARLREAHRDSHTCHILPPTEIDLGLCLAVFAGSGGKYIFCRMGRKGRIWHVYK